ncbi:hypothetical protein [Clostridium pasteurianum]|uniref:Uncharacterized protein n=1 Tax=Clostridium pasteurianum BC1 TaxID=86416 RepID=R4K740_CLOPA|nr:hypothetical protein [Clostridium pasteurianum]AGK96349.1 hypothetical protein Clopa_1368 [Clostridium pasteurianum BC1]
MNEKEKLINTLIDKRYNEAYDINLLNKAKNEEQINENNDTLDKSVNLEAFEDKMNSALEKIDLVDNIDFNINIDTLKIIEQAEQIGAKKNSFKENIYFIITSILILSAFSIVFLKLGIKFVIYFQIVLAFIMPWSLIPLTKYSLRRNHNE